MPQLPVKCPVLQLVQIVLVSFMLTKSKSKGFMCDLNLKSLTLPSLSKEEYCDIFLSRGINSLNDMFM
jgi:hypothetical protein